VTDYFYDMDLVVDPLNPSNVVANGLVSIFDPADTAGVTLLALKDPSGLPLPNPVRSNANGFLPPRIAQVPQTMWKSGGFTGYFNSYKGLRDESVAAVTAAQSAANDASTAAAQVVTTATVDGSGALVLTTASGATMSAGNVKGAKGDKGDKGDKGLDGSNVLPTDDAIKQAINDTASATRGALNATYASLAEQAPRWAVKTRYEAGQYVVRAGRLLKSKVGHVSASTYAGFNATNWDDVGPFTPKPRTIALRGTAAGADAYDSTSHIEIESYQRPQGGQFGESLRLLNMQPKSKSMITWYQAADPRYDADEATNPLKPMVWLGAHYGAQDDGEPVHGHISIEVPDKQGSLQTRWGINWVDKDTLMPGVESKATVYSNSADVFVNTSGAQRLILGAYPGDPDGTHGSYRYMVIASTGASENTIQGVHTDTYRWQIGGTATPDLAGNNGSDYVIQPMDNVGAELPVALFLRRKNGRAVFGPADAYPGRVTAKWAATTDNTVNGFYVEPEALTGGYAAYAALMPAAGDSFIRQRVKGDTTDRYEVNASGKISWGSGAASRDTTLYRNAAGELKTDTAFTAGGLVTAVGLTSTGTQRFGAGASVGGGVGVIGIGNATTVPTSNPGSGVVQYAEAGVAKFRQGDGSLINFAQLAAIAAPTGGTTIDIEARTAINALRVAMRDLGKTL